MRDFVGIRMKQWLIWIYGEILLSIVNLVVFPTHSLSLVFWKLKKVFVSSVACIFALYNSDIPINSTGWRWRRLDHKCSTVQYCTTNLIRFWKRIQGLNFRTAWSVVLLDFLNHKQHRNSTTGYFMPVHLRYIKVLYSMCNILFYY